MLKKTITYTDYNGTERTEDFYFNLTKPEVLEMEVSAKGGMAEMLQNIVSAQDARTMLKIFKDIILTAYGEKAPDGRGFIKVKDGHKLSEDFAQTEAYSTLFMELVEDADKAAEFINGILPMTEDQKAEALKMVESEKQKLLGSN